MKNKCKPQEISREELKVILATNGLKLRPQYKKEDYMFTSFTMPYTVKRKLDRLCKQHDMTRSALVRFLIEQVKE